MRLGGTKMSSYKIKQTLGDTEWFTRDRFGMFIHFGAYAMPARHEWCKTLELIDDEHYDKYVKYFDPDMFDAKEWAKKAKAAGMKYAVLTTKHHEGFCLFDTKYTDYKITNTPFGRDLVREFVDAFRAEGLRVGFYYSLIDWHHPHFPIDVFHPLREHPDAEALDKGRDVRIYAEYMRNQVTELLTGYGQIDIMWFDFSYPNPTPEYVKCGLSFAPHAPANPAKPWMQHNGGKGKEQWESEELFALVRKLAPKIILNNRANVPGDIVTPEQVAATEWPRDKESGECLTWEACHTFSGAWGYARDEMSWKTPKMLIDTLTKCVAFGGNLIMNVGPTSRGCFDHRADKALMEFEKWMKQNSRSIYNVTMAEPEFVAPRGTYISQSTCGKRLYIYLTEYPFRTLTVKDLADRIDYAQFLCDGSEIKYTLNENGKGNVIFRIPNVQPCEITPVIEVFLK